ncbi:MAG: hypothetical protein Q4G06_08100 [Clostridia bacterium]|nr:hypothetical protein [Clostridia bacterium]
MTETKKRKMSAAQRRERRRKIRNRRIAMTVALVLVVALVSVGGTIAWLTATTDPVTNTFTTSDINITLSESENLNLKMVPGGTITKDPKVTVVAGSEDCWLFVKVEKSDNLASFITYDMAANWTLVPGETNVYYYTGTITQGTAISVLKNDQVTVNNSVTKDMMNSLTASNYPTLKFTAYACQQAHITDPATAWGYAKTATVPTTPDSTT